MKFNLYKKLKGIYITTRDNYAHKKVDKKEKLYGIHKESMLLHNLIDNNYPSFRKFTKRSRRANRNPKKLGNLEEISEKIEEGVS